MHDHQCHVWVPGVQPGAPAPKLQWMLVGSRTYCRDQGLFGNTNFTGRARKWWELNCITLKHTYHCFCNFVCYKHLEMVEYLLGFLAHQRENLKLYLNIFKYLLIVQSNKVLKFRERKTWSLKGHPFKVVFYFPMRCKLVPEWSEFPAVRAHSSGSVFGWILGKTQVWNDLLHGCVSKSQCIVRDIKPSYLVFRKPVELTLCPTPWNEEVCL